MNHHNLYDSSSIINLSAEKRLDELLEGTTIGLAHYEIGNAVWKQAYLRKLLTKEEARKAITTLVEVLKQMKMAPVEDEAAALNIAVDEGLTYYDASYIQAAKGNRQTLVTDDERLLSKAKKYVEAQTTAEKG